MDQLIEIEQPVTKGRIQSIDLLRGLVMIIMALDHTRDFFHKEAWTGDPTNMETTTPALFFTRWITHFCAPIFVFLAGTSIWLQARKKSKAELSSFLITRGLWLIFIEIIVMNFAFSFDIHFTLIALQTIWSIAISMIILGLLIWLPFEVILVAGLLIVFGHNSLDFYEKGLTTPPGVWYDLVHHPGFFHLWGKHNLLILYPFLSWTGLMMLGYCFGKIVVNADEAQRKKTMLAMGAIIIVFFIVLRATNMYGDPDPWSKQKEGLFTVLSFLNTHKYPPSLLYMCMTIGPALLFLAFFSNARNWLTRVISVYGRVPFFYYILHFYLIHLVCMALFLARGHSIADGTKPSPGFQPFFTLPGEGYNLWVVYGIWLAIVISLYPLCKWYDKYKSGHKDNKWLSYL